MSYRAVVLLAKAETVDTINAIWQFVFGWGPGNLSIPLSADGQEPATHVAGYAASVDDALAVTWQQLCDGIMPAEDGFTWGEDGCPTEQDAIDACVNSGLIVNVQAGGGNTVEHFNGVLNGLNLVRIE